MDDDLQNQFAELKAEHESMKEVLASIVTATQVGLAEMKNEVLESKRVCKGIEKRVDRFGIKKTKELDKIKGSAIVKLQQLIELLDLKVVDGVIQK